MLQKDNAVLTENPDRIFSKKFKKSVDKWQSIWYYLSCVEASANVKDFIMGGLSQLGAHVTSKMAPILTEKLAKFLLDILSIVFYN